MQKSELFGYLGQYYQKNFSSKTLKPGIDYLPPSAKSLDQEDLQFLVDACLDMWLTTGRFAKEFERSFASFMQQHFCLLTNSGSSANLLAISALTSPSLKERQLKPGDEIITAACGFPTTVNPIVQNQAIPVFVDIDPLTLQADLDQIEAAIGPKTKAIILAHTLGNPAQLDRLQQIAKKHHLWLIEDCCDATGSTYQGQMVGTFGDIATVSFYPAHHMTMGEGGAVLCRDGKLKKLIESFRDWGRDCWCPTGVDNTCGKRFDWQFAELPDGFDHKYVYSHIGYNLKVTDMQAAIGVSQLKKLPQFIEKRKQNFAYLKQSLQHIDGIQLFEEYPEASASWFGFPIRYKKGQERSKKDFIQYLEARKIGTREVFGGNLLRQPLYANTPKRTIGKLEHTDAVMEEVFWIGLHPLLHKEHLDYIAKTIKEFYP
jgi:CDP-6-deoxy-D-xylo-4-hexulose-3-dehydrase